MNFEEIEKSSELPTRFSWSTLETNALVSFSRDSSVATIDTHNCVFSSNEMFQFAMILLKLSILCEKY